MPDPAVFEEFLDVAAVDGAVFALRPDYRARFCWQSTASPEVRATRPATRC